MRFPHFGYKLLGAGMFLLALSRAYAGALTLIDDDFSTHTDSLWHFKAAAFRDGVLSPGLEVQIPGYSSGSGILAVNPSLSALNFIPRQSTKNHRSCFYGYRDDFRIDSATASHIHVDLLEPVSNPSAQDSLGGLFLFVKYVDDLGYKGLARSTRNLRGPQSLDLDTMKLTALRATDWITPSPMDSLHRAWASDKVTGVGLCYISKEGSFTGPTPLLIGGIKVRGELSLNRISGSPGDKQVVAGDTLVLRWRMPPGLGARFHWYRNEKPLPDASGSTYVFAPTLDDVRVHIFRADVEMSNGALLPTQPMKIQVLKPSAPKIKKNPSDTVVPEDGNVLLKVEAQGLEPLHYQWYRDGKEIPGADRHTYSFAPSAVGKDEFYYCNVSDHLGMHSQSRKARIRVESRAGAPGALPAGMSFALQVGMNVSDFYRDDAAVPATSFNTNFFQAGALGLWQFTPAWGMQVALQYARKGVTHVYDDHISTISVDYAEMPLLLRVKLLKFGPLGPPLHLLAGPYAAYLILAEQENDWGDWKATETPKGLSAFDYGAVMGLGTQYGIYSLECRYALGLADIGGEPSGATKTNGSFAIIIGIRLFADQETAR